MQVRRMSCGPLNRATASEASGPSPPSFSNTAETKHTYRGRMPRRRSALVDRLVVDQPGRPQQAILDELRRVILDSAVPPGTPIPLAEVADLFGVSQIPVRESLKTLIGEGLVAHRSNSGYIVAQLMPQELREMYIVRKTLEAASLAAAVANATDADGPPSWRRTTFCSRRSTTTTH
jgi:DNA-binding transcriptional regulator YhcF (GntR family)